jgi:hypothetical protein
MKKKRFLRHLLKVSQCTVFATEICSKSRTKENYIYDTGSMKWG